MLVSSLFSSAAGVSSVELQLQRFLTSSTAGAAAIASASALAAAAKRFAFTSCSALKAF
jgi:hypothetical protein